MNSSPRVGSLLKTTNQADVTSVKHQIYNHPVHDEAAAQKSSPCLCPSLRLRSKQHIKVKKDKHPSLRMGEIFKSRWINTAIINWNPAAPAFSWPVTDPLLTHINTQHGTAEPVQPPGSKLGKLSGWRESVECELAAKVWLKLERMFYRMMVVLKQEVKISINCTYRYLRFHICVFRTELDDWQGASHGNDGCRNQASTSCLDLWVPFKTTMSNNLVPPWFSLDWIGSWDIVFL